MQRQFTAVIFGLLTFLTAQAQSGAFTYQGRLTDNAQPPNGAYLLKFELFDAASEGVLIETLSDVPATVQNGVFTVELNFAAANAFNGAERFLQISVRRSAAETYVTLTPRQKIASAPYAIRALTAENALQIDGTPAAQLIREGDARLSDARLPSPGSGDYIQNRLSTPQTSTNFNISGTGTADVLSAVTQFNLGGQQILSNRGNSNLFIGSNTGTLSNSAGQINTYVGAFAGNSTTTAIANSFFGADSGENTTIGSNNSFFGVTAGNKNTEGNWNSFFGRAAGQNNTTGGDNSFFGGFAGINNTTGGNNVFFGNRAGVANKTGSNNTVLGGLANLASDNLNFATAIGAGAVVSTSNTIVLGRTGGADAVRIPGSLDVGGLLNAGQFNVGTLNAATVNAATQFNLGGERFLSTTSYNTFAGLRTGNPALTGVANSFFGHSSGYSTTTGNFNSFFGLNAGYGNTTGTDNSFFGKDSGYNNTQGSYNTFVGNIAAFSNATGSYNTALGFNADVTGGGLTFATAIGANSSVWTSNTIVLGRAGGDDTVQIPGVLNVAERYNLGGNRFLSAPLGNTFVGISNGANNSSGDRNSFFGSFAGTSNTSGGDNSFFGREAGNRNTEGAGNAFFGFAAGFLNVDGSRNTFIGTRAGTDFAGGDNNTALGFDTGVASNLSFAAAIGSGARVTTSNTIVLGRSEDAVKTPGSLSAAGVVNSDSQYNLRGSRLLFGSSASLNLFLGLNAGTENGENLENSFIGMSAGAAITTGDYNTFVGASSGAVNTSGNNNVFFGRQSGFTNSTGAGNTFIGVSSGFSNAIGSKNTIVGFNANVGLSNLSYATAIGADATVSTSNTIVLGRSGGNDDVRVPGRLFVGVVPSGDRRNMQWDPDTGQLFQDTSSRRYKENIRPLETDFRLLLKAQPQTYTRPGFPGRWEIGFIAEEMDALGLKPLVEYDREGRPDGVNYDKIPLYLTRIAAGQQTEIERLNAENTELKTRLDAQQQQLDALRQIVCAQNKEAAVCKPQN